MKARTSGDWPGWAARRAATRPSACSGVGAGSVTALLPGPNGAPEVTGSEGKSVGENANCSSGFWGVNTCSSVGAVRSSALVRLAAAAAPYGIWLAPTPRWYCGLGALPGLAMAYLL